MTQRTKTLAQLLLFAAAATAVGLYAWLGVYKADQTEAEKKDHDERLFAPHKVGEKQPDGGIPPATFVKVTVHAKGEATVVERRPGEPWLITYPVKAKADPIVMDGLVSQLQTSKFKATVDEQPDQAALKKYGLDEPDFTVEAIAEVGDAKEQRTVKLEGGIENTFDGSVYMRRGGEPAVYLAEGGVRWSVARSLFELRDKEVLAFEEPKLTALAIKTRDNDFALGRDAQRQWVITRPFEALADAQTVAGLLGALKGERAQAFPQDTPDARKAFGLDAPLADATFTLEGGQAVRVRLGRPPGDAGDKLYALREDPGGATLAEMQPTVASQLLRNPRDLRDHAVLHFKTEAVTKVVFHNADGSELVAEKGVPDGSANDWRLTAPVSAPAKAFKLASVLWTLGQLKSTELGEENPKDWGKFGLGAKARYVALFEGPKEVARFTIGNEVPAKPKTYWVRGTRNQPAEVDGSRFTELPSKPEDLADTPPPAADAGR